MDRSTNRNRWLPLAPLLVASVVVGMAGAAIAAPVGSASVESRSWTQEGDTADGDPEPAPLSEEHREWLEEEVVYIISETEERVFRELSSDAARDDFIEAFWRARDPTPGTVKNEFREKHYARIRHANRYLGRETPREGWQTDRGRVYIQLGEPLEVQHYNDPKQFWPMELWFYRTDPEATDLPAHIYLLFFRPEFGGEFRLYDPITDGPQALAKQISLQMAREERIVNSLLRNVGHEVALASVNMNAAERVSFGGPTPSTGNALIRAAIERAPLVGLDLSYARTFAAGRGETDARVDFHTIPTAITSGAFWDDRGLPHLHYAVQVPPERMLLGQHEDDYYLSIEVSYAVSDLRGTEVVAGSDRIERYFGEEKADRLIRAPLAFFDRLDLIPGVYDLSVTLENLINRDGSLAEARNLIPATEGRWQLSDLLLADRRVSLDDRQGRGRPRAFRFGGTQYLPLVGNEVAPGGEVILFAQVRPPSGFDRGTEVRPSAALLDGAGEAVKQVYGSDAPVAAAPEPTGVEVTLPVEGVDEGSYTARLSVELPDGTSIHRSRTIVVRPGRREMPMPEILMAGEPPPGVAAEYRIRAEQHRRKGEIQAAEAYLRAGLERQPGAVDLRRMLGRLLLDDDREQEAVAVLRRLVGEEAAAGDLLLYSRALRAAGSPEEAVSVARTVLRQGTPTSMAYNELGAALAEIGDAAGAVRAYRQSLTIDPEQPEVRRALERLGEEGASE